MGGTPEGPFLACTQLEGVRMLSKSLQVTCCRCALRAQLAWAGVRPRCAQRPLEVQARQCTCTLHPEGRCTYISKGHKKSNSSQSRCSNSCSTPEKSFQIKRRRAHNAPPTCCPLQHSALLLAPVQASQGAPWAGAGSPRLAAAAAPALQIRAAPPGRRG